LAKIPFPASTSIKYHTRKVRAHSIGPTAI